MSENKMQNDRYAHVTDTSLETLRTPQERSVWAIKLLGHRFVRYLLSGAINPDKIIPSPKMFDLKKTYDGHTIFSQALEMEYYKVAGNYIRMNKNHPDFQAGLNLTDERTIQALRALVAPPIPKKNLYQTPAQRETAEDKRLLCVALMDIFLPKTIAYERGMRNETDFSAALKLGTEWKQLRPAYRILQGLENKSQEVILRELNLRDEETKKLLKEITSPHTSNKHHRILTAKLQQLLTSENFVEQVRGKRLAYQAREDFREHMEFYSDRESKRGGR